jgi:CshA-type fibril repeat protein
MVPAGTASGTYNVKYQICENLNPTNCDEANATVWVETNPTIGNEDNRTATTGKPITINVLVNDQDKEDDIDPTTVKIIDPITQNPIKVLVVPNEGTWEVNTTNGEITFTPEDGFTGDPTPITYVVSDSTGNISEPVSVNVDYPQTAPVAVDDNKTSSTVGDPISLNVLENDTDSENDINISSVSIIGADDNQELLVEDEGIWLVNLLTGEITFTPADGFKGNPIAIKYTVADRSGQVSNEATIRVYYPQTAPIGVDDNRTAQSGETVSIMVLDNDHDLEDDIDPTTVGIVYPLNKNLVRELMVPTEGVWSVDTDTGEITFVPEDGFTNDPTAIYYQVKDKLGNGSSDTKVMIDYPQTATKTVADVKDGETGEPVVIDVLANDIDDENDTLPTTVRLLDKDANPVTELHVPNEGTWSVNPDTGVVTFTPLEGITFDPTPIEYTVEDTTGQVSVPVSITVDYPQTPADAKEDYKEGVSGQPVSVDVLENDSDVEDDIDPTTVTIVDRDGNSVTELDVEGEGVWRVDSVTGVITFTPNNGFTADPTMIVYTVKDLTGEVSLPVKVVVDYPQTAPKVVDDTVEVDAGTTIVTVLENDSDAENDIDLTSLRLVHPANDRLVDTLDVPNEGTWSVDRENGTVMFVPLDSFIGNPTPVAYRVSDRTNAQSLPALVTIIYPQPMALEDDVVNDVEIGNSVSIPVLENDTIKNVVVDTLQITGTKNAGDNLVVIREGVWSIENGMIIFTPEDTFVLNPTPITYSLEDVNGEREHVATVTVNYVGKVRPDKKVTDLSLPVTVNVLANDSGALDSSSVEIVLPDGFMDEHPDAVLSEDGKELLVPEQGTWTVNNDGTITYRVEADTVIVDPTPISYKVYDKNGHELETDAEIILKNKQVASVIDTQEIDCAECEDYNTSSVSTFSNMGLLLLFLLFSMVGVFFFKKEKHLNLFK